MARSHVKELAREAFELDHVVVDEDGDLPFPYGTAVFYATIIEGGQLLRVWSRAVAGLRITKPVLREMDQANNALRYARVSSRQDAVWVEGCFPVEALRTQDLAFLFHEVGSTADRLGSMLAAVHGGVIAFPDEADSEHRCEE